MLPLARLALARGYSVWGSDAKLSREAVADLKKEGIYAAGPPSAGRIDEMEGGLVVYSTAISESHPERMRAQGLHSRGKLRLLHRMDFLNELVAHAPLRLGMAGTHGKTSSTALAGWMLMELQKDPLIIAGGRPLYLDRSIRNGERVAVFETDESDGSFLRSNATHRLILNADEDHLNYYGGFENLQQAFQEFASSGTVIYNTGDPGLIPLRNSSLPLEGYCIYPSRAECMQSDAFLAGYFPDQDDTMEFRVRRHHLESPSGARSGPSDSTAGNTSESKITPESNQRLTGPASRKREEEVEVFYRFRLGVPGRHFASNALGILGLVLLAFDDLDIQKCIQALESFPGTERRLECLGTHKGMPVYDDYGHHPSEIRAVLDALTQRFPGQEIRVVFQPHRYTRTRELASSFAASLAHADRVFLLPLYSAGEEPVQGVDSALIASYMPANKPAQLLDDDVSPVFESSKGNPIVLFLGAGDVSQTARKLFRQTI